MNVKTISFLWYGLRYKITRFFWCLRFNLAAQNTWIYRFYLKRMYSPSPGSVEFLIDAFSKSKKAFTVLQIGANDGFTHDPIQKFARRDDWKGVVLEPQTHVVKQYTERIYSTIPGITVLNAALGEYDGETELYKIAFSNERWASGVSRFDKEALKNLIEEGRLDKRIRKNAVKPPADKRTWIEAVKVPLVSFVSIFKAFPALSSIDLLMVDTEGFDAEVIRLFPFDEVKPGLVAFEDMLLSDSSRLATHDRLKYFGYNVKRMGPNTVAWQPSISHLIV